MLEGLLLEESERGILAFGVKIQKCLQFQWLFITISCGNHSTTIVTPPRGHRPDRPPNNYPRLCPRHDLSLRNIRGGHSLLSNSCYPHVKEGCTTTNAREPQLRIIISCVPQFELTTPRGYHYFW